MLECNSTHSLEVALLTALVETIKQLHQLLMRLQIPDHVTIHCDPLMSLVAWNRMFVNSNSLNLQTYVTTIFT